MHWNLTKMPKHWQKWVELKVAQSTPVMQNIDVRASPSTLSCSVSDVVPHSLTVPLTKQKC